MAANVDGVRIVVRFAPSVYGWLEPENPSEKCRPRRKRARCRPATSTPRGWRRVRRRR